MSCILSKCNTLQQIYKNMVHLKNINEIHKKILKWYICSDKKIKKNKCKNLFFLKKKTILEVIVTFYILHFIA